VKRIIRRALRLLGLDVRRFRPGSSEDASLVAMLAAHRVNLVVDVGANTGQFGQALRSAGYGGRIVSFEPLSSARKQLVTAARNDALWDVADQMAIGSENGEIEIHIAGNSVSSSVLPMLESHAKAAPASVYVGSEKVPVRTLDSASSQYLRPDTVLFLKIDTQGYEDRVLRGAVTTLRRAIGLQLELSLMPLYEGQRQYEEMAKELKGMGFELWNMTPAFVDPRNGRLLQIDGTFFRPPADGPGAS
jgi:FkbM family methyltransferase